MDFDVTACFAGVDETYVGHYTEYKSGVYRLHYVISGSMLLQTPSESIPLVQGKLYLIPPTLSYSLFFSDGCTAYKRLFFTFLPKRAITSKKVIGFDCPIGSPLRYQIDAAIAYLESEDTSDDTERAMLSMILRLANLQSPIPYLDHPGIERALQRIHDAYASPLTAEQLAALADMEKTAFIRAFHRATGRPPLQYVTECRVRGALRMMLNGMNAASASVCAGFSSHSAFSLACKKLYGVPPVIFLHSLRTSISRKDMII